MNRKREPPSGEARDPDSQGRLSLEEFKRLVAEAQERGEPAFPIVKRLVLQAIDEASGGFEDDKEEPVN